MNKKLEDKLCVIELITKELVNVSWVLVGSTSLALQGVNIEANDIDILTDEYGAKHIDEKLNHYCIEKIKYSSTDKFRSYFGKYMINNIKVEIMGNLQHNLGNDNWSELENINDKKQYIRINNLQIPVFSLLDELVAYKRMGRINKVKSIEEALNRKVK